MPILTRRRFLDRVAAGAAVMGVGHLLDPGRALASTPGAVAALLEGQEPRRSGRLVQGQIYPDWVLGQSDRGEHSYFFIDIRTRSVWNALTWVKEGLGVTPELAVSWEADETATVWEYRLRKGVTFHGGREFTSADAVASTRLHAHPDLGGVGFFRQHVEGVEATGPVRPALPPHPAQRRVPPRHDRVYSEEARLWQVVGENLAEAGIEVEFSERPCDGFDPFVNAVDEPIGRPRRNLVGARNPNINLSRASELNPAEHGGWEGPGFERCNTLLGEAAGELDEARRTEIYHQMQRIAQEEVPGIMIGGRRSSLVHRPGVHNLRPHTQLWQPRWEPVWMEGWGMGPVAALIPRRLALSGVILALVSAVVFVCTEVPPGDALDATIPADQLIFYTEEDLARMRAEPGLDRPPLERFAPVLWGLATFDFGVTPMTREPVLASIWRPMLNSLLMAPVAVVLTPIVAVSLGVLAAPRPGGRLDGAVSGGTLAHSMPDFVVGNVIVFAIWLGLAPAVLMVPQNAPWHEILTVSVLPIAALVVSGVAYQRRLLRAGMVEALGGRFVERARLSGLPEWRLVVVHALSVALIPMLNGTAQFVAGVISGAGVIEAVFRFPCVGLELIRAVAQREVPTVQAVTFLAAFAVIASNLLADIVVLALDPRVRRRG